MLSIRPFKTRPAHKNHPAFETLEPRTLFSATDLSILSFGDSITFGVGGGENQSYRYYLSQALDRAGVSYDMVGALSAGAGYDNDHHGISGARAAVSYWGSTGYRPSLTESLQNGDVLEAGQAPPNVILLHIGTNSLRDDAWSVGAALSELSTLLTEMASQWRSGTFASDVAVVLADVIPGARSTDGSRSFSAQRLANTHAYNAGIQSVIDGLADQGFANRIHRVDMQSIRVQELADAGLSSAKQAQVNNDADAYVDWFNGITETNPGTNANGTNAAVMIDGDWLHPTALGYEVMGLTWFNALSDAGLIGSSTPPTPTPTPVVPELAGYTIEATGDFNGDGHLDALYRRIGASQTSIRLFQNGVRIGNAQGWAMDPTWTVTGSQDQNGDGKADIYWERNGQHHAWIMDGTTIRTMVNVAGPPTTPAPTPTPTPTPIATPIATPTPQPAEPGDGYTLAATGDFDGDGDLDRLYRNVSQSATLIWIMQAGSMVRSQQQIDVNSNWSVTGVSDLNGDGREDIQWASTTGRTAVWYMTGTEIDVVLNV